MSHRCNAKAARAFRLRNSLFYRIVPGDRWLAVLGLTGAGRGHGIRWMPILGGPE